ncbi:unannotated protein [freshwater metagenome]|uniref:Unannotated protein n=1 Tax=freshwater metagenome TaxID=449393 RepID=A0A6J7D5B5_9ZZZZ|nr:type IV pilus assembly protein PilM [Actinomycetota bacterium]
MAGKTAIGLDIGTTGVRAAELSFGKNGITLEKFGQVELAPGCVRDGEVVDVEAVATAIKRLWAHTKFSSKEVVIGVANGKVIVRQVDLPWMSPEDLKQSLPFQVQEFIPIPVEEAVLDFMPVEDFELETGARMLRGLLVAASRDMVMGAVQAVQQAGLVPAVVDLTSFALLRSLSNPTFAATPAVEAVLDIGARVTNIVIHEGGVPRFVRILLMGGADVTESVAERMGVPTAQAESLKQAMSVDGNWSDQEVDPSLVHVLDASEQSFVDEVRGSLDYYLASTGSAPISELVVSGGGARLVGLATRLSQATGIQVTIGSPTSNLLIGKTGLTEEQLAFLGPLTAVPVGLAMAVHA